MRISCFIICLFLMLSCTKHYQETQVSFDAYKLEEGFELQALVVEPLIEAPVNISFDDQGRLWAIEMSGYMQNIEGLDPAAPVGRIMVFEDKDADGQMDHTKIFLDSLKLVRAIAHVYGGLLYAEPPNLYFRKINKDLSPGPRKLVDSAYAVGGNVEHQPNGLLMNIDNWIYNAKSSKRYRLKNGQWLIEATSFRGQWGITRDNIGRLIYNDNSNQVRGDWALPNLLNQNKRFKANIGLNVNIVEDQRVYPLQATAVNRGYIPGNLDEEGKLKNFTSACGPVFYEGTAFPETYQGNVFVCGPEVNLIKRNIIDLNVLRTSGKQAYQEKEFLVSEDEAFRPVNLQNGPDGALYVVDMHRGIIQHKTYMTSYLRDLYLKKGLDSIVGMGRILKIVRKGSKAHSLIDLSKLNAAKLVDSLASRNAWVRDRAQQMLVATADSEMETDLNYILTNSNDETSRLHAFYTLEGLGLLKEEHFIPPGPDFPALTAHLLKMMPQYEVSLTKEQIEPLMLQKSELLDYHLAFYLAKMLNSSNQVFLTLLLDRYQEADWFLEPVLSGLASKENAFFGLATGNVKTKSALQALPELKTLKPSSSQISKDGLTRGLELFRQRCASCHGPDGKGIKDLAPPLLNSEFVSGQPAKLAAIILYGMTGPLTVDGQSYQMQAAMPGLANDMSLTDAQIKDIGNYVRNAFTTAPQTLRAQTVDSLRQLGRPADSLYTVKELKEAYGH